MFEALLALFSSGGGTAATTAATSSTTGAAASSATELFGAGNGVFASGSESGLFRSPIELYKAAKSDSVLTQKEIDAEETQANAVMREAERARNQYGRRVSAVPQARRLFSLGG